MTGVTETSPSKYARSRTTTARIKSSNDLTVPTRTSMTPATKHAHDTSLVTLAQEFAFRVSKRQENYQKFSETLLKNKSLLVQRRLAIKRQRSGLRGPLLNYEPIRSEKYQIELGNSTDVTTNAGRTRIESRPTTSPEDNITQTTSNHSSALREDTSQQAPTDISLMYRYVDQRNRLYHGESVSLSRLL